MSIANYFTFFRIFISPIFFLIYIEHEWFGITPIALPYVLLTLLIVSELSDAMDGYLARRFNQVTDFGKILDPMADSIYRISIFLTFTQPPVSVPILLIFLFLYRDSVISMLRTICALRGYALAARPSGKLKAVIQAMAIFAVVLLLIPHSLGYLTTEKLSMLSAWIVGVAAGYTLLSGIDYIYANRHYIRKSLTVKKAKR